MTLLPNGKVLVAAGYSGYVAYGYLSRTELYDTGAGPVAEISLTDARTLPSGAFRFSCANRYGSIFTALATTNLALPVSNWTTVGILSETSPGQFQFTDSQGTTNEHRFYRVRSP